MPALVVTRPQPDATLWVQQLLAQGVNACALPMMVIGPSHSTAAVTAVQQALQQLQRYRALMLSAPTQCATFLHSCASMG